MLFYYVSITKHNKNKYEDEKIKNIKERRKWLEEERNKERIKQGRKSFEYKDEIEEKHIKASTADKESGYYHRDSKEKGFMYLDNKTVDDKCNIIVDVYVTKGNVHDSGSFIERAKYIKNKFGFELKKYAVVSGCLTLDIKNIAIKNDNVGKKPFTLSSYINMKTFVKRKTLEKI